MICNESDTRDGHAELKSDHRRIFVELIAGLVVLSVIFGLLYQPLWGDEDRGWPEEAAVSLMAPSGLPDDGHATVLGVAPGFVDVALFEDRSVDAHVDAELERLDDSKAGGDPDRPHLFDLELPADSDGPARREFWVRATGVVDGIKQTRWYDLDRLSTRKTVPPGRQGSDTESNLVFSSWPGADIAELTPLTLAAARTDSPYVGQALTEADDIAVYTWLMDYQTDGDERHLRLAAVVVEVAEEDAGQSGFEIQGARLLRDAQMELDAGGAGIRQGDDEWADHLVAESNADGVFVLDVRLDRQREPGALSGRLVSPRPSNGDLEVDLRVPPVPALFVDPPVLRETDSRLQVEIPEEKLTASRFTATSQWVGNPAGTTPRLVDLSVADESTEIVDEPSAKSLTFDVDLEATSPNVARMRLVNEEARVTRTLPVVESHRDYLGDEFFGPDAGERDQTIRALGYLWSYLVEGVSPNQEGPKFIEAATVASDGWRLGGPEAADDLLKLDRQPLDQHNHLRTNPGLAGLVLLVVFLVGVVATNLRMTDYRRAARRIDWMRLRYVGVAAAFWVAIFAGLWLAGIDQFRFADLGKLGAVLVVVAAMATIGAIGRLLWSGGPARAWAVRQTGLAVGFGIAVYFAGYWSATMLAVVGVAVVVVTAISLAQTTLGWRDEKKSLTTVRASAIVAALPVVVLLILLG